MQTKTKIGIGVLAVAIIVALLATNTELFQGKLGRFAPVTTNLERKCPPCPSCPVCPSCPTTGTPVTRAELMRLLVDAFRVPVVESAEQHFSDVPPDHWAFQYIETMYANGFISDTGTREFRPNGFYNRAEFAALVSHMIAGETGTIPATADHIPYFNDVPDGTWFTGYVRHLYNTGAIRVDFRPSGSLTRDFADSVLANAAGL